ncbi:hypothetical protein BDA99DRAFT_496260 [Phascolomyces articulosus]|uniref:Uncharacterized protein n=1 Tax=Phascolomyces articulosus TaxID=60185 RepID=A0AAD5PJ27_9FUNG|nr:hypothetical protein BDA99DRAFT_496260 [Phascolomyces articulosus]
MGSRVSYVCLYIFVLILRNQLLFLDVNQPFYTFFFFAFSYDGIKKIKTIMTFILFVSEKKLQYGSGGGY